MERKRDSRNGCLTHRQLGVLAYLDWHVRSFGFPPTHKEVMGQFGFNSSNAVQSYYEVLERKGCIARVKGKSRAIAILPTGKAVLEGVAQ